VPAPGPVPVPGPGPVPVPTVAKLTLAGQLVPNVVQVWPTV
jgi:hypothetical protein